MKAFTGPGTRQPGEGNPDFWIRSGTDVYYTGGNVSIGTMDPGTKLHIVGAVTITDPSTTLQLGDWGSYVCARNVEPTPGACPTGYTNVGIGGISFGDSSGCQSDAGGDVPSVRVRPLCIKSQ